MNDNYATIVAENVDRIIHERPVDLAALLPGEAVGGGIEFNAFGEPCRIDPSGIALAGKTQTGVLGIIISLYALHAAADEMNLEPLRAFKEFSDTAPYHGAFASHTEQILVTHVEKIRRNTDLIKAALHGSAAPPAVGGDFSFVVRPFPKIALCYIFYEADEDFPASATCLFSSNADRFMPNDGLADTGEYTSKKILSLIAAR